MRFLAILALLLLAGCQETLVRPNNNFLPGQVWFLASISTEGVPTEEVTPYHKQEECQKKADELNEDYDYYRFGCILVTGVRMI
jgi:hypothetical protein